MEVIYEYLESKNVTLGPIQPHSCYERSAAIFVSFLVPSLNQRANFARELSEDSLRVSRVLENAINRFFYEISRFIGKEKVNLIPNK